MRVGGALKTVAVYEALKGVLVLLIASGVYSLLHLHRNVQVLANELIEHYHIDPNGADPVSRYSRVFLEVAGQIHDRQLWIGVIVALAYVALRFIEAWGLWFERRWAEWLTALSGAVYIPFELLELWRSPSLWSLTILTINVAIVSFMAYCLRKNSN